MHFYSFDIGDYYSHTMHLSCIEDLAYRRLLDACYTHEKPLITDLKRLAKTIRMEDHQEEITYILNEFFELTENGSGWVNKRVCKEIAKVNDIKKKASEAAKKRWEQ